jgi:hypothetical protein
MLTFQRLCQVAELQEKAKGACSPAPAVAHKTSSSPSSSVLRTRCGLLQRACTWELLLSCDIEMRFLFDPLISNTPLTARVEELSAELENLKRLSAQKQLQDKVRDSIIIHDGALRQLKVIGAVQERVKLLKANLKKSDEELQELAAVICHCR